MKLGKGMEDPERVGWGRRGQIQRKCVLHMYEILKEYFQNYVSERCTMKNTGVVFT